MKINKVKALVGVLATSAVVSLVGSISGTMAWLQYNTRSRVEMQGTTAKCSENLQVRAVIGYDGGGTPNAFSDWKEDLDGATINTAAAAKGFNASGELAPVTYPAGNDAYNAALDTSKLYGNPVCGYEEYDGTQKWEKAAKTDIIQFDLQFRAVDVDGETVAAGSEALFATNLYLRDISLNNASTGGKDDLTKGVRIHLHTGTTDMLLGLSDDTVNDTFSTTTHGYLDLDGDGDYDAKKDVPNYYSWSAGADNLLDYGSDAPSVTAYNLSKTASALSVYPTDNGKGALSGGVALGETIANTSGVAQTSWLTVTVTIWLEGWTPASPLTTPVQGSVAASVASVPTESNAHPVDTLVHVTGDGKIYKCTDAVTPTWVATGATVASGDIYNVNDARKIWNGSEWAAAPTTGTVWDDEKAIGAKFDVGFSFGITTLAYTPIA